MNYIVNSSVKLDLSNPLYMEAGIHENVELIDIKFNTSEKGNEFLAFTFTNPNGETLVHTEWKPDTDDKILNQIKRIKQIALSFIPEDRYNINAADFKSFSEQTIALLSNACKGIKVRIKAVYKGKYVTLPSYSRYTFIERMSVEKSSIKILGMDSMTPPQPTQGYTGNSNPFSTGATSGMTNQDLLVNTNVADINMMLF
jgi:hypothetical protein